MIIFLSPVSYSASANLKGGQSNYEITHTPKKNKNYEITMEALESEFIYSKEGII